MKPKEMKPETSFLINRSEPGLMLVVVHPRTETHVLMKLIVHPGMPPLTIKLSKAEHVRDLFNKSSWPGPNVDFRGSLSRNLAVVKATALYEPTPWGDREIQVAGFVVTHAYDRPFPRPELVMLNCVIETIEKEDVTGEISMEIDKNTLWRQSPPLGEPLSNRRVAAVYSLLLEDPGTAFTEVPPSKRKPAVTTTQETNPPPAQPPTPNPTPPEGGEAMTKNESLLMLEFALTAERSEKDGIRYRGVEFYLVAMGGVVPKGLKYVLKRDERPPLDPKPFEDEGDTSVGRCWIPVAETKLTISSPDGSFKEESKTFPAENLQATTDVSAAPAELAEITDLEVNDDAVFEEMSAAQEGIEAIVNSIKIEPEVLEPETPVERKVREETARLKALGDLSLDSPMPPPAAPDSSPIAGLFDGVSPMADPPHTPAMGVEAVESLRRASTEGAPTKKPRTWATKPPEAGLQPTTASVSTAATMTEEEMAAIEEAKKAEEAAKAEALANQKKAEALQAELVAAKAAAEQAAKEKTDLAQAAETAQARIKELADAANAQEQALKDHLEDARKAAREAGKRAEKEAQRADFEENQAQAARKAQVEAEAARHAAEEEARKAKETTQVVGRRDKAPAEGDGDPAAAKNGNGGRRLTDNRLWALVTANDRLKNAAIALLVLALVIGLGYNWRSAKQEAEVAQQKAEQQKLALEKEMEEREKAAVPVLAPECEPMLNGDGTAAIGVVMTKPDGTVVVVEPDRAERDKGKADFKFEMRPLVLIPLDRMTHRGTDHVDADRIKVTHQTGAGTFVGMNGTSAAKATVANVSCDNKVRIDG